MKVTQWRVIVSALGSMSILLWDQKANRKTTLFQRKTQEIAILPQLLRRRLGLGFGGKSVRKDFSNQLPNDLFRQTFSFSHSKFLMTSF